jgi:hypothetical protein
MLIPVADLKTQPNRKGKYGLHSFCLSIKCVREEVALKGTTGMARLRGSAR